MARGAPHRRARDRRGTGRAGILRGAPSRSWSRAPGPALPARYRTSGRARRSRRRRTPLYERRHQPPAYPNLRINLPLRPAMVVTVEPGLYFVPALLQDPERRAATGTRSTGPGRPATGLGGIRIEDNLLDHRRRPRGDHRRRPTVLIGRGASRSPGLMSVWSFCSPSRIRPLTVPVGRPRWAAIPAWHSRP